MTACINTCRIADTSLPIQSTHCNPHKGNSNPVHTFALGAGACIHLTSQESMYIRVHAHMSGDYVPVYMQACTRIRTRMILASLLG